MKKNLSLKKKAEEKKELESVVTFKDKVLEKIDPDIVKALAANTKDNGMCYHMLDGHMQIVEKDLNIVLEQYDDDTAAEYVFEQRNMLQNAYYSFISTNCLNIANKACIKLTSSNVPICDYNKFINEIVESLICAFPNDCRELMEGPNDKIQDLDFMNHQITNAVLRVSYYLKNYILKSYVVTNSFNIATSGEIPLSEQLGTYNYIENEIEDVLYIIQMTLVNLYVDAKKFVQSSLYPLGYPNVSISYKEEESNEN